METDTFSAYRSLYMLSTAVGLAPKRTFAAIIWSIILLLLVVTGFLYSTIHYALNLYPDRAPNLISADILSRVLLYGTSAVCLLGPLVLQRGAVSKLLGLIGDIDRNLYKDPISVYAPTRKCLTLSVLTLIFAITPFFCFHAHVYGKGTNLYNVLFDELAHVIILVTDIQFIVIVLLLWSRCRHLNFKLKNIPNKGIGSVYPQKRMSNATYYIHSLRKNCSDLHDICLLTNKAFGFSLLLELTCILISMVSTFYNLMFYFKETLNMGETVGTGTTLCHIIWMLLYLGKVTGIAASCHFAASENVVTGSLVQKLLLQRFVALDMVDELQNFFTQLSAHGLEFTACGIFPINLSLLHSIVSAAATYIIILLQFG